MSSERLRREDWTLGSLGSRKLADRITTSIDGGFSTLDSGFKLTFRSSLKTVWISDTLLDITSNNRNKYRAQMTKLAPTREEIGDLAYYGGGKYFW